MQEMMREFKNVPIGLSDHSVGINTSLGAIALGASIIEKHLLQKIIKDQISSQLIKMNLKS